MLTTIIHFYIFFFFFFLGGGFSDSYRNDVISDIESRFNFDKTFYQDETIICMWSEYKLVFNFNSIKN